MIVVQTRPQTRLMQRKEWALNGAALLVDGVSPFISAFIFRNGPRSHGGKNGVSKDIVIHIPDDLIDPVKHKLPPPRIGVLEAIVLDVILDFLDRLSDPDTQWLAAMAATNVLHGHPAAGAGASAATTWPVGSPSAMPSGPCHS
jgi:hypothetical protein